MKLMTTKVVINEIKMESGDTIIIKNDREEVVIECSYDDAFIIRGRQPLSTNFAIVRQGNRWETDRHGQPEIIHDEAEE